jgi:L-asparaginase/beta-aspartyl-peptidase (threonine type)
MALKIAVHGGVGNSPANLDGCVKAAEAGIQAMRNGDDALAGAVAAAVSLENDGRFNAGTGSSLRMDGKTIEMDAGVMDSTGRLGAVAAIQRVKNPVLVAREVAKTPHWLIVGDGALAFARALGFEDFYQPTQRSKDIHVKILKALMEGTDYDFQQEWRDFDFQQAWNFETRWDDVIKQYGSSTIGAVAMDAAGNFAATVSTGGSSPMLRGRVGDSPIVGCGFYAGKAGAIVATGIGEYIVKEFLCRTVYDWVAQGMPLQEALDKGVGIYPNAIDIGLIGVTPTAAATSDNRQMPGHVIEV